MQEYRIRPDGFAEIKKQTLKRSILIFSIIVIAGIIIFSINVPKTPEDVNIWPIYIPLVAIAMTLSVRRALKRQKTLLESYILSLSNNLITREQVDTPSISIYFSEVSEIARAKNGSFIIKGAESTDQIIVPSQIEDYAGLEAALEQIKPITSSVTKPLFQRFNLFLALLAIGLMIIVYTSMNKLAVAISGILLIALQIWGLIEVQRNKNIDVKTKKSLWMVLIVIASVLGVMIMKLRM